MSKHDQAYADGLITREEYQLCKVGWFYVGDNYIEKIAPSGPSVFKQYKLTRERIEQIKVDLLLGLDPEDR